MIYCVIPRELEGELFEKMVAYYEDNPNVTVIVDRREGPDRRAGQEDGSFKEQPRRSRDRRRARAAGTFPDTDAADEYGCAAAATIAAMATATFESLNPSTGEVIESFPRSTAADVDRAVATARAAWEDWRLVPAPERGNILFRFAQLLEQRKPELSDLMTREMGKVKAEAGGDVQEAIDMSYYMGGEGRRLFGQTTPSELRDKFMMSVRMPVGVVGAITPWNFPIAIPAWKLTPGARLRQHRRPEAGGGHAAPRAAVRRPAARGGPARGRRADRARLRRGGGRRARPPSRRAR